MSGENSSEGGGPNWTLGLDKLTTPTMEFFGIKLRDTIRSYLNSKARERAAVRKFEREFFIRQSELLYYSADQYASGFSALEAELLDRAFVRFENLVKKIAEEKSIEPMRVLELVKNGVIRTEMPLPTSPEVALYHSAAYILDVLVASYSMQSVFHYCFIPSVIHRQNPSVSDEELDAVMADEATLDQIQEELAVPEHQIGLRIAKTVGAIYGVEWEDDEQSKG